MAQMIENLPAIRNDQGSIPGSRRSPGEGNGNPLQYSCLENPMDRRAWQATVHGITESRTQLKQLLAHMYLLNRMWRWAREHCVFF